MCLENFVTTSGSTKKRDTQKKGGKSAANANILLASQDSKHADHQATAREASLADAEEFNAEQDDLIVD